MSHLPQRYFKEEGPIARVATRAMRPLMMLAQGNFVEEPRSTFAWNRTKINDLYFFTFLKAMSVTAEADLLAGPRHCFGLPVSYLPTLSGWKNYVVLEPVSDKETWFLGWFTWDTFGVSGVPIRGPVRALRSSAETRFFGINRSRKQVPLFWAGSGTIGQGGPYCQLPLL